MYQVDLLPTDMGCLYEFHPRCTLVVSRLKRIDSGIVIIAKDDICIINFRIFEIIPTRLELVEFTIFFRGHWIFEGIAEYDEIIGKSIFCIWCDISKLDRSFLWSWEIGTLHFGPGFRY